MSRPEMLTVGVLALIAAGDASCATDRATGQQTHVFAQALQSPATGLGLEPLAMADGTTVQDCAGYLKARRAGVEASEAATARITEAAYVACAARDALLCGTSTGTVAITHQRGKELAARLDLRQVPSSLGPRLDNQVFTLEALKDPLHLSDTDVLLASAQRTFRLQIAAEADVDRDGTADWIVWLTDELRDGNYRGYATYVIPSPAKAGPLRALAWPPRGSTPCR